MSMDPSKWIDFDQLSAEARGRVETLYPYLKVEQCQFQEKDSGVFMKHANSVKIEKLLDPPAMMQRPVRETATRTRK